MVKTNTLFHIDLIFSSLNLFLITSVDEIICRSNSKAILIIKCRVVKCFFQSLSLPKVPIFIQ